VVNASLVWRDERPKVGDEAEVGEEVSLETKLKLEIRSITITWWLRG